jgi:hypothetical protein
MDTSQHGHTEALVVTVSDRNCGKQQLQGTPITQTVRNTAKHAALGENQCRQMSLCQRRKHKLHGIHQDCLVERL